MLLPLTDLSLISLRLSKLSSKSSVALEKQVLITTSFNVIKQIEQRSPSLGRSSQILQFYKLVLSKNCFFSFLFGIKWHYREFNFYLLMTIGLFFALVRFLSMS